MKICFIAPLPPPYGGITHWATLVYKHSMGIKDVNISFYNISPKFRGIHEIDLFRRIFFGALQFLLDLFGLAKKIGFGGYDVFHVTTSGSFAIFRDIYVGMVCRLFGKPFVYHLHFGRVPFLIEKKAFEFYLLRIVLHLANIVVAIDRETFSAISVNFKFVDVRLVPNCVDFSLVESPNHNPDKRVVFVGWVVETKGIEDLLLAWNSVPRGDWLLDIVGPYDHKYFNFLNQKYNLSSVNFTGGVPHEVAMNLINKGRIFVLPSHTEGFPNVILEAMAMNKCIIASDVGAIPEILADGCGAVVGAFDVVGLSDAINRLTTDSVLCDELASNAYRKVNSEYEIGIVFEAYQKIWCDAIVG